MTWDIRHNARDFNIKKDIYILQYNQTICCRHRTDLNQYSLAILMGLSCPGIGVRWSFTQKCLNVKFWQQLHYKNDGELWYFPMVQVLIDGNCFIMLQLKHTQHDWLKPQRDQLTLVSPTETYVIFHGN